MTTTAVTTCPTRNVCRHGKHEETGRGIDVRRLVGEYGGFVSGDDLVVVGVVVR
jgi:hypothetical protein